MAKEDKNDNKNTEESAEQARALNVKKTLESKFIQNVAGSNLVKSNPYLYSGELGFRSAESLYDGTMSSEDAKKIKDQIFKQESDEGKKLGVAGEPTYPTGYDVSVQIMRQLEEILSISKLSELEKAVQEIGAKLDFKVPDELKNYIPTELIHKAAGEDGKVDVKSLSQEEQHALGLYQTLSEFYKRACALKAVQANYFADLNAQGTKIADLYKKEDKKEQEKKE
jgi:hypothetical protein